MKGTVASHSISRLFNRLISVEIWIPFGHLPHLFVKRFSACCCLAPSGLTMRLERTSGRCDNSLFASWLFALSNSRSKRLGFLHPDLISFVLSLLAFCQRPLTR